MNEVVLDGVTEVGQLAELLEMPAARVVEAGFRRLGLLLTVHDDLVIEQTAIWSGNTAVDQKTSSMTWLLAHTRAAIFQYGLENL